MPQKPEAEAPFILRLAVGGLGLVFLGLAILGAFSLYADGWRWGVFALTFVAAFEAVDFLVAASRQRGSWPTLPFVLFDLLTPW